MTTLLRNMVLLVTRAMRYPDPSLRVEMGNPELIRWEETHNTIRPHQALGYLSPLEFIKQRQEKQRKEAMCH